MFRPIKLKQIATNIGSGITPSRSNKAFWENGTIPWVKTEQIGQHKIYDSNEKISEIALRQTSIKLFPANTISVAMYGEGKTRGNVSILKREMTTNQACCNIVIDDAKADHEYVYYYLKTQYNQLRNLSAGVRKNLNSNDIKEFEIRLPREISHQKRTASVLSNLDSKIELNNQIIEKLESMAKTIFNYWFVQFDFPNRNGNPYRHSGGKMKFNDRLKKDIPQGWNDGIASDLFDFNPSLSLRKNTVGSYIDMNALPESGFMTSEVQKKAYNGGVKFQNGDVVVARITPCLENGKTGLITLLETEEIGFGSTEFIVLRGQSVPLSSFAACLSRSELFRKYAITNMTGTSGRKRVEADTLARFPMAIPPDYLLEAFENSVGSFVKIATTYVKQNQQLANLRDWLLPMLMNGQVKVSDFKEELAMAAEPRVEYKTKKKQKA